MNTADLIELRATLSISQITMASRIGLSLRAFRNIESGKAKLRRVHQLAIERVLIGYAIDRNDPELLGDLQSALTNMILFDFSARAGAMIAAQNTYRYEQFNPTTRSNDMPNSSARRENSLAESN